MQNMKVKVYRELDNQITKLATEFPIELENEYVKNGGTVQQKFFDEFKDKTRPKVLGLVTLVKEEYEGNIKRGFDCIPVTPTDDCDFSAICHFCIGTGVGDERFLLKATIQE